MFKESLLPIRFEKSATERFVLCCYIKKCQHVSQQVKFRLTKTSHRKPVLKLNASATTFCRPFCMDDLLPSKKGCWRTRPSGVFFASFWRTKKGSVTFCRPFLVLDAKKSPEGRQKSRGAFFVLQFGWQPKKDSKKSARPFWPPKGRLGEKDGKKSWHLRSP